MKKTLSKIAFFAALPVLLFTTVSYKSDFFEIAKQLEIFTTLFKELNMNYVDETNPAALMDTAINAMLEDLDPYTHYWNEQEVQAARIDNAGEYTGIGATVGIKADKIVILEPYKNYPADKAGLKAGDEIIKIGNIAVENFSEDAGELLKGAPNSKVALTFKRRGEIKTTSLTRGAVEIKAVPFYKLLEGNTGYIVLSQFNRNASAETAEALRELKEQGAEKIILDLRGNPGGLLSEAINVTNIFVPQGELITSTKSAVEKYNQTFSTTRKAIDTRIPLAVLINGRSASASEIVAGSLQDLDRAVILGARSFGKGLVQRPKDLTYGTQLKVTISRYYTPSGRCIQALDYRHRDEEGNALRYSAKDYNEFKTRNGRKVYDGGGILPDIKLETSEFSDITNALLLKNAIFDYATNYYYTHKLDTPEEFSFTEKDYSDFKDYLKSTGFEYQTATEKELEDVVAAAEKEGYQQNLSGELKSIKEAISNSKEQALNLKKAEIMSLLSEEIIKRYFYKEGLYEYYVKKNPEILKAKEILQDKAQYQNILKG
ncbi:S41 family peptidase [Salinimicrobium tongyeongense]|uniref:S41 family peptidase n=1 Tax=Salinimicrobium tongyeongense TaxID=2809707 RepID=A0ABY6NUS4_9FLAO|nr:S41 family peptidase [Salinimicrobium tongyeongense]UZH56657.1 S41 family peptidase [Salinimicrobium tongyeongense]